MSRRVRWALILGAMVLSALCAFACAPGGAWAAGGATALAPAKRGTLRGHAALPSWPTSVGVDFSRFPRLPGPPPHKGGQVFWVDAAAKPGGVGIEKAPFRTITEALGRTEVGGVVLVRPGIYDAERTDDFIAIRLDKRGLRLEAVGEGRVVVRPSNPEQRYGIGLSADDVVVRGINLEGFVRTGVYLDREGETQRNVVIADLDIVFPDDGVEGDGIVAYGDGRKRGKPVLDGLLVSNVRIRNPRVLGISCNYGPCHNWRIQSTRVEMPGSARGNSGADAFAVESGDNFVFVDVHAEQPAGDGVDVKGTRVAIYDSSFRGVGRNAIKLWRGGEVVNTLSVGSGADAAVVFGGKGRYVLLNCLIAEHNFPEPSSYLLTAGHDAADEEIELLVANSIFYRHSGGFFLSRATRARFLNNLFGQIRGENFVTVGRPAPQEPRFLLNTEAVGGELARQGLGKGNTRDDELTWSASSARDRLDSKRGTIVDRGLRLDLLPALDRHGHPRVQGASPDRGPDEAR